MAIESIQNNIFLHYPYENSLKKIQIYNYIIQYIFYFSVHSTFYVINSIDSSSSRPFWGRMSKFWEKREKIVNTLILFITIDTMVSK